VIQCGVVWLIQLLLRQVGVEVEGGYSVGTPPAGSRELFAHKSEPLRLIVDGLNHYSTNFVAEQLAYAIGRMSNGKWDHAVGLERMQAFLQQLGAAAKEAFFIDASGLSHGNRLSARAVSRVLFEMANDVKLAPEFESSLSVAGRSGTLTEKHFGVKGLMLRAKTGTINGVSALAGYLTAANGKKYAFALLQNGGKSKWRLERSVLKAIYNWPE